MFPWLKNTKSQERILNEASFPFLKDHVTTATPAHNNNKRKLSLTNNSNNNNNDNRQERKYRYQPKQTYNAKTWKHDRQHWDHVLSNEITLSNMARINGQQDSEEIPMMWFYGKDYDQRMENLAKKQQAVQKDLQGGHLQSAYDNYTRDREIKILYLNDEKWDLMVIFRKILHKHGAQNIAGSEKCLYEMMFKANPSKFMTHSRFLTVMRLCYGFEIASIDKACRNDILHQLNTLYATLDVHSLNKIDWRVFLLMLRALFDYEATPYDHLMWAFALYGSAGCMDLTFRVNAVKLGDLKDAFASLANLSKRKELENLFSTAWVYLCGINKRAAKLSEKASIENIPQGEIKITYIMWVDMLRCSVFEPLWMTSSRHSPTDPRPWTYVFEEYFYHPILYNGVIDQRRADRNLARMQVFIGKKEQRSIKKIRNIWVKYLWRRARARYLIDVMKIRYCARNVNDWFFLWRINVLKINAAVKMQKIVRGRLARVHVKILRSFHVYAMKIQRIHRGNIVYRKYSALLAKRKWAVVEIQRWLRAPLGRRMALLKLEGKIDRGIESIYRERERMQRHIVTYAAIKIQTVWRMKRLRWKYLNRVWKFRREELVKEHIASLELEHSRQMLLYKKGLARHYDLMKLKHFQDKLDNAKSKEARKKILIYRRKLAAAEKREKLLAKWARERMLDDARIDTWLTEWDKKKEQRADERAEFVEHILGDPDNKDEEDEQKEILKEIQVKAKELIQTAKKDDLELEEADALVFAREQVIDIHRELEKEKVHKEMRAAAAVIEEEERKKEEKKRLFEEGQAAIKARTAIITLDRMYYKWAACRAVRFRGQEVYEKRFDPTTLQYFYFDKRTDKMFWEKPWALGSYDLPVRNLWHLIKDEQGTCYYYNQYSMDMLWEKPVGTTLCSVCNEFSARYCNYDYVHYCREHHDERHKLNMDKENISWKEFEGGIPGSNKIELENIEDEWYSPDEVIWLINRYKFEAAEAEMMEEEKEVIKRLNEAGLNSESSGSSDEEEEDEDLEIENGSTNDSDSDSEYEYSDDEEEENSPRHAIQSDMCVNNDFKAKRMCNQCKIPYCIDCFNEAHAGGSMKQHTFYNVDNK